MDENLQAYFQEILDFFHVIIGQNIKTIDLTDQPLWVPNKVPFKTDGKIRSFGNGVLVEDYTVVIMSLVPNFPFFSEHCTYGLIVTPLFDNHKETICKVVTNWVLATKSSIAKENEYIKQKIDHELSCLFVAIQLQDAPRIEESKKELERLRQILLILQN